MPYTRPPGPRIPFDRDEIVEFLRLLDATAKQFTFKTFKEKGDSNPEIFPRIIHAGKLGELRKEHELGGGVFVCVNATDLTGRSVDHIVRVRAIWQEDDDGFDGALPLPPSMIVELSPKHFHRYWLVDDVWPADGKGRADFAAVMERMVESYGSDKGAKDISRVLRVPGFLHRKVRDGVVNPFMVHMVEASGRRYTRAQIFAAFPPVAREPKQSTQRKYERRNDDDRRIHDALKLIKPDDREIWRNIGMALKDHCGESGRPLWDQWSRRSDKYNEREQDKAWRSFGREGITIGSLFHYAKQAGWNDETRRRETSSTPDTADERESAVNSENEKKEPWREGMISARDLCSMRFAPLKFAVSRIIPEGLTIFAGRPKIGKSWLTLLLGTVLANGVAALGLDYGMASPLKGSVLYLGLEDGRRRLQRRMTKLIGALPANWPEQLYLKTEWRRFDQGGLNDIRAWHEGSKAKGESPVLVIVDTLAKVRAPGNSKTSPYQNDHDALAGLQKLAEEIHIAVVVNHHDRKMDAEDVFDTVSGTLGLTGAVDTILVLTRKAQGTTLHIRGRDIEDETSLAMQFNKETGRWSVLGSAADVHRSNERTRILKVLANAPDGLSVSEIMTGADMRSRNATDILLFKLAEAGDIERVKRGVYGLPGTKARVDGKARSGGKNGKKERSAEQATENKEKRDDDQSFPNFSAASEAGKIYSTVAPIFPLENDGKIAGKIVKPLKAQANSLNLSDLSDLSTPKVDERNGHGPIFARVSIREIRHPAISAGPHDSLDDFIG